jgi:hypothetical protein
MGGVATISETSDGRIGGVLVPRHDGPSDAFTIVCHDRDEWKKRVLKAEVERDQALRERSVYQSERDAAIASIVGTVKRVEIVAYLRSEGEATMSNEGASALLTAANEVEVGEFDRWLEGDDG